LKKFEEIESYDCAVHPERPGVGICTECGAVVCADCAEFVSGRLYCRKHKPVYEENPTRTVSRQRLRFGILTPVLLFVALIALGLWFAPTVTSGLFRFYESAVTEMELKEVGKALESFKSDVGRYPTNEEGLLALRDEPAGADGWLGPYLPEGLYVEDKAVDTSGKPLIYQELDDGYRLQAIGPDGEIDTGDDVVFEGPQKGD
jgi:general secretion pathway protein G